MTNETTTMTYNEAHAILDQARFGDTLTVVRNNGGNLTSTVSGLVLGDQHRSPAVGIDMLNGDVHTVREHNGKIWGAFQSITLEKGEPR